MPVTLPPKSPVMTGAEVAVGAMRQMSPASAMFLSILKRSR